MHSFVKDDGVWACACGLTRDRHGHDIVVTSQASA